jgi:hypothetical protein
MPRFAVLTHDHPFFHWDFLLEAGKVCRTWRLLEEPRPGRTTPAEPLPDHRLHYLTYEGPVGGGRGTVARYDAGWFEWVVAAEHRVEVTLEGDRLRGRCFIEAASDGGWRASFATPGNPPAGKITLS